MGRNNADFHGVTFRHQQSAMGGYFVFASHPDAEAEGRTKVGYMQLKPSREVLHIHVDQDFRRKGIATGMWNYAKAQGLDPQHSIEQTPEGRAWANSVGDW